MADGKEYVSRPDELGNIHISEEVRAVIAAAAAMEVEGVGSLAANLGSDIAELLGGKKNLSKGIHIAVEEESIRVDVSLLIKYGYTIIDVAKEVQNAVYSAIENTSGLTVSTSMCWALPSTGMERRPSKGRSTRRVPGSGTRLCMFFLENPGCGGRALGFLTLRGICSFLFMHGCCIIQSSMTKSRGIIPPWRNRNDQNCCPRDCRPLCL